MSKKLKKFARKILFEDTWQKYGSEYMSHPVGQGKTEESYLEDLPVNPSDLMPNRIAIEKPPIEDEKYVPNNHIELSSALAAIGEEVPDSKVEKFYHTVKNQLDSIENLSVDDDTPTEEQEEQEANQVKLDSNKSALAGEKMNYENRIRKIIRNMLLNEAYWGDIKLGGNHYPEEESEEDFIDPADVEDETYRGNKREIKGKYVAPYYGKSGDSGVTVGIQRLFANYLQHIGDVEDEDIKDATDYISFHFQELDPSFSDPDVLRVLRTFIFKKIVKDALKNDKEVSATFLPDVVAYVKKLRKGDMKSLLQRARTETADEKKSDIEFVELLKNEDPEQYSLFIQMFPSYEK